MYSWHRELHNYHQGLHNPSNLDDFESNHYHLSGIITDFNGKIQMVWCR